MGEKRWRVFIHRKAEKTLKRLHGDILDRTRRAIRLLESDPRPAGYKKMVGFEDLYRIRVGDWRIIYTIEDDKLIILVLQVAVRSGMYRKF